VFSELRNVSAATAEEKLTYGTEQRNGFSSLPLAGIDRSWPALSAKPPDLSGDSN
jgi:hypothetical protein